MVTWLKVLNSNPLEEAGNTGGSGLGLGLVSPRVPQLGVQASRV